MDYDELMTFQGDIYLNSIFEPQDNALILDIDRCKVNETMESAIKNYQTIDTDETLPILRIEFDWYIAYSVRNEGFTVMDEYEVFEGNTFCIYSKSRYLDFVEVSTIASDSYPGPFKHYGIVALNHIIDVISQEPPTITLVNRTSSNTDI
ncbi:hypothetical protein [Gottfriedia solisilvae]|uniref:Uncharacterized protein n=1 Tax=Gottfriedia solisilvae TaxID=1516104 RepID=A0A8J3AJL3_9BACI|nr:hypothetical protein [Gottfriedia solisilvae]GGI11609.1 hypothetical protein GCM10007380_08700 [Gottfriedia solisilvae]